MQEGEIYDRTEAHQSRSADARRDDRIFRGQRRNFRDKFLSHALGGWVNLCFANAVAVEEPTKNLCTLFQCLDSQKKEISLLLLLMIGFHSSKL